MADVEFLRLGEFESEGREFDAVSFGRFLWQGLLKFEEWPGEPRIAVYSDRRNVLDSEYATRPGKREEVLRAELARAAIMKAILSCFDHTITTEALSDGRGGWIPFETDT
ncbi:MAG TPA: hypothetical protein VFH06_02220 [Candidatus Saccharimonadales bacterium]|nr:hypothetical protein [Candidatus Saccharimonadales bacterium]